MYIQFMNFENGKEKTPRKKLALRSRDSNED
jgi:hypothetical protein